MKERDQRVWAVDPNAQDYQQKSNSSIVIVAVTFIYFIGMSFFPGNHLVEIGWALLTLLLIALWRLEIWLSVIVLYTFFIYFFLLGVAFDSTGKSDVSYLRTLASWTIFSALLFASLRSQPRKMFCIPHFGHFLRLLSFIAFLFMLLWSLSSLQQVSSGAVLDHREIVGENYLVLADLFAMSVLAFMSRQGIWFPIYLFLVISALAVLFFLSSRSSMVFFMLALLFTAKKHISIRHFLFFAIPLFVLCSYYFFITFGKDTQNMARMAALVELSGDESSILRRQIREDTIAQLADSPFCLIVPCHPERGKYDHSILSVIQFFGLPGIIVFLFSITLSVSKWRCFYRSWYFPLFIYCVLSLAFSRAWVSSTFPVGVALLFDALTKKKLRCGYNYWS